MHEDKVDSTSEIIEIRLMKYEGRNTHRSYCGVVNSTSTRTVRMKVIMHVGCTTTAMACLRRAISGEHSAPPPALIIDYPSFDGVRLVLWCLTGYGPVRCVPRAEIYTRFGSRDVVMLIYPPLHLLVKCRALKRFVRVR